ERFLQPVLGLGSRLGPVIFEFPRVESADRLEGFFLSLPKGVATWALEAKEDLGLYARMMEWGVAPVLQISSRRAPLSRQWMAYLEAGGGSQTMPLVVQADLHPSLTTEEATRSFQPYSCLVREDEEGREALREITKFARQNKRKAFILFHNRWEGSAPWSVGRFLAGL
ncbi:MAG: DUF72 domain-containing protein, partial [Bdellovibrionales bacterium]|nr:DUF72 domain-containing protein [Bdellovibrionales bacterium]